MSRSEIIRITCDVCGKDFDVLQGEADLCRYTVPVTFRSDELLGLTYVHVRQETIDLCNACAGKLAIISATPITMERPFPTGQYTFKFSGDEE